jgi:hypothetical protein
MAGRTSDQEVFAALLNRQRVVGVGVGLVALGCGHREVA